MDTFRPPLLLRIWHLIVGSVLCWSCVMAPVGLYLYAVALFRKVEFDAEGIVVRPIGGRIPKDQVERWGRYVYRRQKDRNRKTFERIEWVYITIQTRSGKQVSFCADDFADGNRIEGLMRETFGDSTGGLEWSWMAYGPRF